MSEVDDARTCAYERPQHRGPADDLGVVLDVNGGWDIRYQRAEILRAANNREEVPVGLVGLARQLMGHSHLVDRFIPLVEGEARLVAKAVSKGIEISGLEAARNAGQRLPINQERSDYGLLSGDVVWL